VRVNTIYIGVTVTTGDTTRKKEMATRISACCDQVTGVRADFSKPRDFKEFFFSNAIRFATKILKNGDFPANFKAIFKSKSADSSEDSHP